MCSGGCAFVTGWWCFAAPRVCADWRNTLGSVQVVRKDHLKVVSRGRTWWSGHFPPMFLRLLLSALEQASLCHVDKWGLDSCIFSLGFCYGFSWDVYLHVAFISFSTHRVNVMDCVAVLIRKKCLYLFHIFFLSSMKVGESARMWLCFIRICSPIVEAVW